ncbi:UbiA family prenyltransferase [Streptomyces sp. NPDC048639]|uniref:UbiA family prenyltransferase n=1 Tax=Streptomyces sp. NPDC048639 TaxID=3365581 RepID=UPI003723C3E7
MAGRLGRGLWAHVQTWRPYTLWYPGLVGVAGAALAGGSPSPGALGVAWAAPTLGWLGGHYLGDFFDRRLDAIGKPQRPIPSGRLSPRAAVICGTGCAVGAAVVTVLVSWLALVLVAAAMAGVVAYAKVFKARGLSGNAVRGALTAITVLHGALTVTGQPPWRVLPFALVFAVHDTASNLVGTLRDVAADRAGGYRTLPVLRGVRPAAVTAARLYAAALALASACAWLVPASPVGCLALLLLAGGCGAAAYLPLLRPGREITPPRALAAHEVLVSERLVLAAAVVAGGIGPTAALSLLLPLLAVTVLAQSRMRARYELAPSGVPETSEPAGLAGLPAPHHTPAHDGNG